MSQWVTLVWVVDVCTGQGMQSYKCWDKDISSSVKLGDSACAVNKFWDCYIVNNINYAGLGELKQRMFRTKELYVENLF